MRWTVAAIAAAMVMLGSAGIHSPEAKTSKTVAASLKVSKASASTTSYPGSQCDSNTYSGQCSVGICQCVVISGNVCDVVVGKKKGNNRACAGFFTIDDGLATGNPGCSPVFGVVQVHSGESSAGLAGGTLFLTGTYCPTNGTNFSGGWVLDLANDYNSGSGSFTGATGGSTLTLDMKGTVTAD